MKNKKQLTGIFVGILVAALVIIGCDNNSTRGSLTNPTTPVAPTPPTPEPTDPRVTITTSNIQAVLATSMSGTIRMSLLVQDLVAQLPTVNLNVRSIVDDLSTRDCKGGGTMSVDAVKTNGATLNFNQCVEDGKTLNGSIQYTTDETVFDATFNNFTYTNTVQNNISLITLDYATAHIDGTNYAFVVATGKSKFNLTQIDLKDYKMNKDGDESAVYGQITGSCMNGQIDIETQTPFLYNSSETLVGGQLIINGKNSNATVIINADNSVTTLINGSLYKVYQNVEALPDFVAYCKNN